MPDKHPGRGGQEAQGEPPVNPYLDRAKRDVNPHDFSNLAAYQNALGLDTARLEFDDVNAQEAAKVRERDRLDDARRSLEIAGVYDASDETVKDEADRADRENDWSGWN